MGRRGRDASALLLRGSLAAVLTLASPVAQAEEEIALFREGGRHSTWLRETKHEDPRGVFTIDGATLRISGDGYGYIATEESFRNYRLTLDYRWGDQQGLDRRERKGKALDSGVFLHATGPHGNSHDGGGAYMAAIECNIFEGATGDSLLIRGTDEHGKLIAPRVQVEAREERDADGFPIWQQGGKRVTLERWGRVNWPNKSRDWKDVRGFRGRRDIEKPPGEWNTLVCLCRGASITVTLNGVTVNHVTNVWPTEGKILLQCEGAEIVFRDVRLTPLGENAGQ